MISYFVQMLAPATCENIICEDPIDLFGTNHKVLGEDGTCPTKVIMGKLYDFRCYFCKILPRVGMANRFVLCPKESSKTEFSTGLSFTATIL